MGYQGVRYKPWAEPLETRRPWSVTDTCKFSPGLSRFDGTSHVLLLYDQGLSLLSSPVKAHYGEVGVVGLEVRI